MFKSKTQSGARGLTVSLRLFKMQTSLVTLQQIKKKVTKGETSSSVIIVIGDRTLSFSFFDGQFSTDCSLIFGFNQMFSISIKCISTGVLHQVA